MHFFAMFCYLGQGLCAFSMPLKHFSTLLPHQKLVLSASDPILLHESIPPYGEFQYALTFLKL